MQKIIDCCGDPIVVYDRDGLTTYINPAFERVFGWHSDELMGKRIDFVPEKFGEQTRKAADRVIAGKAVSGMETVRKTKNKGDLNVRLSANALKSADGKFNGMVVTLQDITDLVLSRQEAVKADKAKNDFLSNVSHEIRTPMNGLMGMIDLIRNTPLNAEQQEYMEALQKSAADLMSVISDILDFSKMESGEIECSCINFDLRITVDAVKNVISAKAKKKGLSSIFSVHQQVPALLKGDPEKLRQILTQLLENAVKFTHQGEIGVFIALEKDTTTHATLRFEVTDTGIGIEPDLLEIIFESFSQADSSATRKYGGTGIGLSISRQLTHLLGGKIDVTSKLGKGSVFRVILEFEKQPVQPNVLIHIPKTLKGQKILIVDDDASNRLIIKEFMNTWGCVQDEAASAKRALEKLNPSGQAGPKFDIVLISMQMMGTDGEILAKQIRSNPDFSKMILIMLSSMGKRGDVDRLKEIGVQGYLPQPVDALLLFDCIATAMAMRGQASKEIITRHFLKENKKQRFQILLVEAGIVIRKIVKNILIKYGYPVEIAEDRIQTQEAFKTGRFNMILMEADPHDLQSVETIKLLREIEKKNGLEKIIILVMTSYRVDQKGSDDVDEYIFKPITADILLGKIEKWIQKIQDRPGRTDRGVHKGNVFNFEAALERAMDDKSLLEMVINEFIKSLPEKLAAMKEAVLNQDSSALTQKANSLRGSASTIGADMMSAAALELEKAGDVGDPEPMHEKFMLLESEYQTFIAHVKTMNWSGI